MVSRPQDGALSLVIDFVKVHDNGRVLDLCEEEFYLWNDSVSYLISRVDSVSLTVCVIVSTGSEEAFRQSLEGLREQIVSDDVIFWCLHAHHCGLLALDNVKKKKKNWEGIIGAQ